MAGSLGFGRESLHNVSDISATSANSAYIPHVCSSGHRLVDFTAVIGSCTSVLLVFAGIHACNDVARILGWYSWPDPSNMLCSGILHIA
jgi:hypothetical protein